MSRKKMVEEPKEKQKKITGAGPAIKEAAATADKGPGISAEKKKQGRSKEIPEATAPAERNPRKAKKDAVKKPAEIFVESMFGNQISAQEILSRVPGESEKVYVKPEENRAYWVSELDTGSIELW